VNCQRVQCRKVLLSAVSQGVKSKPEALLLTLVPLWSENRGQRTSHKAVDQCGLSPN